MDDFSTSLVIKIEIGVDPSPWNVVFMVLMSLVIMFGYIITKTSSNGCPYWIIIILVSIYPRVYLGISTKTPCRKACFFVDGCIGATMVQNEDILWESNDNMCGIYLLCSSATSRDINATASIWILCLFCLLISSPYHSKNIPSNDNRFTRSPCDV